MTVSVDGVLYAEHAARKFLLSALVTVVVLTIGLGGLAATTDISGAVVSRGSLVSGLGITNIKHPSGGIVTAIPFHEGDHVTRGDIVLTVDETQAKANLAIISNSLSESLLRRARLQAEMTNSPFDQAVNSESAEPISSTETDLFGLRLTSSMGRKAQLAERIGQLERQIEGVGAAETAKRTELDWTTRELEAVRGSYERQMVPLSRLTELERAAAQQAGELGTLQASIAELRGQIAEVRLQIIEVDDTSRTDAANQMLETESRISELQQRQAAARDEVDQATMRAPIAGIINQMAVKAVGAVIGAGETFMTIVPEGGNLAVETRVVPADIDQVHLGQSSGLKFSAFNQRTTPEVIGTVTFISPDLTLNADGQTSAYVVRIDLSPEELDKLGDVSLLPGMPVEVFIQSEPRSLLSYFLQPMSDQFAHAFRE